jgi:hypothetical protein
MGRLLPRRRYSADEPSGSGGEWSKTTVENHGKLNKL